MFDWDILIGKTIKEASKIALEKKCFIAVTKSDGEFYMGTQDNREDRVNVELEKGVVVKVNGIY